MEKFDYQKTLSVAKRLIDKFGSIVTKQSPYDTSIWDRVYNSAEESFVWTNIETGQSQTTEPEDNIERAEGVIVNISKELLENTLVSKSDKELLIVEIAEPATGDTYVANGISYKYIAHTTVNPAGTVLLYKIAVRK